MPCTIYIRLPHHTAFLNSHSIFSIFTYIMLFQMYVMLSVWTVTYPKLFEVRRKIELPKTLVFGLDLCIQSTSEVESLPEAKGNS